MGPGDTVRVSPRRPDPPGRDPRDRHRDTPVDRPCCRHHASSDCRPDPCRLGRARLASRRPHHHPRRPGPRHPAALHQRSVQLRRRSQRLPAVRFGRRRRRREQRPRQGRGQEPVRRHGRRGRRERERLRLDHRRRRHGRAGAPADLRHLLQRLPGELLAALDRLPHGPAHRHGVRIAARSSSTARPPRATSSAPTRCRSSSDEPRRPSSSTSRCKPFIDGGWYWFDIEAGDEPLHPARRALERGDRP